MPETRTPVIEPSLINEPPIVPPAATPPEKVLFPDKVEASKPVEPDAPKPTEPAPEVKKEEPKDNASKPSTEPKSGPIDYESLKLPEGSPLSNEELTAVKKEAKENGLSLDEAQGVLEVKTDAVKAYVARQEKTLTNLRQEWKASWLKDPEYGGDKATESTELAKRAWDKLADNELKTLADRTGWGDHPAVMRMLARAGRIFSEDQLIRGSVGAVPKLKDPAEILYGATTPAEEPMS